MSEKRGDSRRSHLARGPCWRAVGFHKTSPILQPGAARGQERGGGSLTHPASYPRSKSAGDVSDKISGCFAPAAQSIAVELQKVHLMQWWGDDDEEEEEKSLIICFSFAPNESI